VNRLRRKPATRIGEPPAAGTGCAGIGEPPAAGTDCAGMGDPPAAGTGCAGIGEPPAAGTGCAGMERLAPRSIGRSPSTPKASTHPRRRRALARRAYPRRRRALARRAYPRRRRALARRAYPRRRRVHPSAPKARPRPKGVAARSASSHPRRRRALARRASPPKAVHPPARPQVGVHPHVASAGQCDLSPQRELLQFKLRLGSPHGRKKTSKFPSRFFQLRGEDLNLRPSGYEPDELPGCSTARQLARNVVTERAESRRYGGMVARLARRAKTA
jgi:hypothetical protein